jgi:PDZ domain-containing protein
MMTLVVALVPIVAFGLLLSAVTVPFVSLGPGPTFNTLGEVEGKEVVDIKGTEVKPTSGNLNMTTVSQSDGLTLGQALRLWIKRVPVHSHPSRRSEPLPTHSIHPEQFP